MFDIRTVDTAASRTSAGIARVLPGPILALLLVAFVTGCGGTAEKLSSPDGVTVCLGGECGPARDRLSREQMVASLLLMLKENENTEAVLCDTDPGTRQCANPYMSFFVQGGPIPGVSTFGAPYLSQVGLDKQSFQIKYASSASVTWMGTPVFCQDQYTEITVASVDDIVIENPAFACTWTIVPHVWNAKFVPDFIDFDKSTIAGNYAIAGGGLLTGGGGSGTFRLELKNKKTLEAGMQGSNTSFAALSDLPSDALAAPVPDAETVKSAGEGDELSPDEKSAWEAAAQANSETSYRSYLAAYPNGRFRSTAEARLKAVREVAARDRELALWDEVKDSRDPARFDAYLAAYPSGLFADLAAANAQELRAAETERAKIAAEREFWQSVRASNDVARIESYLKAYPQGQFAEPARARIALLTDTRRNQGKDVDLAFWQSIEDSADPDAYRRYMQTFPNGLFVSLASARYESLRAAAADSAELAMWADIEGRNDPDAFEGYLAAYPTGRYAALARQLADSLRAVEDDRTELALWNESRGAGSIAAFDNYLRAYPNGRFVVEARRRKTELGQEKRLTKLNLGRFHALVIGINGYPHLPKLNTAQADARSVGSVLERAYGFNVTYLIDPDRKTVIDTLSTLRRKLTVRDNLLIYYAGHGQLDAATERGYWLPVDAEPDSPANWISTTDVSDMLKAMKAKHVMVVADSCYSGTLIRAAPVPAERGPDYLRRLAEKRTRVVLTSGGLEPVMDGGGGGHSVFARAFLTTLEQNDAILEGTELFDRVRKRVISNAEQTPEYSDIRFAGHDGGDFLFVRQEK